jgi:metallo-beta-lactamase class B
MEKLAMAIAAKLFAAAITLAMAGAATAHNGEIHCSNCKAWNVPQKPFNIYGNTWYVGTAELSALLVTSPEGHILLDGDLPQSAPLIEANIIALGFRMQDVKLILNSHENFDHAGGIARLQRASGATVVASVRGAKVLEDGVIGKDDPQFDPVQVRRIEKVASVRAVTEGEVLRVGKLALTAHMTPGHAPGSTTWSWTSCENQRCLDVVYADSLNPSSADGFRFSDSAERVAQFKASIDKVAALKCDIIVAVHPGATNVMEKLAAKTAASNPFIDPNGCRDYAAYDRKSLADRLASEKLPAK